MCESHINRKALTKTKFSARSRKIAKWIEI